MFEEIKSFFEGKKADGHAAAEPVPAAQIATSEESRFSESSRTGRSAATDAAPPAQSAAPSDAHSKKSSSSALDSPHSPLEQKVIDEALKKCFDPEIPVNIWELGLIYSLAASPEGVVDVKMTLTAPACPVAGSLPGEVEQRIKAVEGVKDAKVEVVWDPPWNMDMMSRLARVMLGM